MPTLFTPALGRALRSAYQGHPVAPSDTVDLPTVAAQPCVGLFIGGPGTVVAQLPGGGTATLSGLVAGQYIDLGCKRVLATGTTATGLVQLVEPRS